MRRKKREGSRARRCLTVLGIAVCLVSGLAGCGSAAEKEVPADSRLPVIQVGCDTYAPFSYVDVDGNLIGIDIELAREAFHRMGYEPEFATIEWEQKKELLADGTIDCVWSCFTMDGREEEYRWAGPYMTSHQVIAVNVDSGIETIQDLEGKVVAVQSTTKPEEIIRSHDGTFPELRKVISVQKRDLMFVLLSKGYVDAIGAHDTSVEEFMKESGMKFRILEEPLLTVGLGVAFDRNDDRGLDTELTRTLDEMKDDGTTEEIIGKYLPDTERYLGDAYED